MWGCEEVVVGTLVNIVEHATSPPHCTSLFFICCHKRPNKPFSICTTSLLCLTHTSYLCHCISSFIYEEPIVCLCDESWLSITISCMLCCVKHVTHKLCMEPYVKDHISHILHFLHHFIVYYLSYMNNQSR